MTRQAIVGVGVFAALVGLGHPLPAQQRGRGPQPPKPSRVVRLDPALDALVPPGATIEKVADGFGFAEGPVWSRRDSALIFSDIPGNTIYRLTPDGQRSIVLQGLFKGQPERPGQHIGSNGLAIDHEGRLIVLEHGNRRVSRLERDGSLTVLADKYDGKRLNSPNDVAVKSDGSIYFTDPPYGLVRQDEDPAKELPYSGIFRYKDGHLDLLSKEMPRPNGIGFSPDERYLYVADSDDENRHWMRFEVKADGTLGAGKVFYDVSHDEQQGLTDGLTIDSKGNLFGTGPAGVWIITPEGKALGRIEPPEQPANAAFGDDGKTLYITARRSVYRIRLATSGPLP